MLAHWLGWAPGGVGGVVDKMLSAFTLLAAPTFKWVFCATVAAWWWSSRALKLLPRLRRRPSSFFLIPPFAGLSFVMALVEITALLTIRKQQWLTRQVQVGNDGQIVRTGAGS
jgi:hypothetical protein